MESPFFTKGSAEERKWGMTPREIVVANMERRSDAGIGFYYTNGRGRPNDFAFAGCAHSVEKRSWIEEPYEYYTDILGNNFRDSHGLPFRPCTTKGLNH